MADALPASPPQAAIVVTGSALTQPRSERAYGVELIDRGRIARSPTRELDQLLKEVPGVQLFRRSDARSGHPTSQGVTLRALGGNASSRALLVLDGVPQSDPFGGWVNWPAYDLAAIESVRVVRGGGSVGNGPGALAGTIELTSRSDAGASGEISGGSRASLDGRARLGFGLGSGLMSLSAQAGRSDGFVPITANTRGPADDRAPHGDWGGRARWAGAVAQDVELQASASGFHDWRTRGTDFAADRTNGADASLRLIGRVGWQWSALGYWQWRNLMSSFASVEPGRTSASRVSLQDSVPSHGLGGSIEVRPPLPDAFELRIGADARRTDGESRELYAFADGEPTRRRRAGGQTWTSGAFAEAAAELGRLTLTAGARLDRWQVSHGHLFEKRLASGEVTRDDRFATRHGWLPTARGGLRTRIGNGLDLRGAAYLGWRMATLNELFRPFRAGLDATAANPELDPERLAGAEAGVDFTRGDLRLSLTGFVNRLRDAIANVTLGQGPGTFAGVGVVAAGGAYRQRQNVDAVRTRGVEAGLSWSRGPWSGRAAASWTHARVRPDGPAAPLNGLRPAQTPRFAATLAGGWQRNSRSAELVLRRVGGQYEDDLNSRTLKGATTLDAFASWPITRRLELVGRGENIGDALVVAAVNGDGSIERATPRTWWIGLRLR